MTDAAHQNLTFCILSLPPSYVPLRNNFITKVPDLGPESPLVTSEMSSRVFCPYSLWENEMEQHSLKIEQKKEILPSSPIPISRVSEAISSFKLGASLRHQLEWERFVTNKR